VAPVATSSDTQLFVQIFDGSKTFSVEPKYDGERILAHVDVEARLGAGSRPRQTLDHFGRTKF